MKYLIAAALAAVAGSFAVPALAYDQARCEKMKTDLADAQAEYKSDAERLKAGTPELDEARLATLAHDQKKIAAIEVQISAEGCPNAKPLADAPRAIGGSGDKSAGTGTGKKIGPDGKELPGTDPLRFDGDYDTHTELGLLHLELDPDNVANGFEMQSADYKGPAVPCENFMQSNRVYRGYFKPPQNYSAVTNYAACDGICVMACVGADGILVGKFGDRSSSAAFKRDPGLPSLMGTFMLKPQLPDDRFTEGNYTISGSSIPDAKATSLPWRLTRE